ncbi:DUF3793 family protein [uncultured Fenollaria sp.]|uniref:DUF3793 family protein n=1 Tax=uncultured Fenollaria sp. TaxID=1686315 RepID=UPI0025DCCFA3|nr:DUF3793 family protein [uncultured Fenollaria sp.]
MSEVKFESILANHCAPVLMGTKLANLISLSKAKASFDEALLKKYKGIFTAYGIAIEKLCECEASVLLLIYNEERLAKYIQKPRIAKFLKDYGYEAIELDQCLSTLKAKLRHFEFPHEIGIFLGFPIDDVIGFIENEGQNYVYCRYWKVYARPESTKRTFDLYDGLRTFVKTKLMEGYTIERLMREVYQGGEALHSLINAA